LDNKISDNTLVYVKEPYLDPVSGNRPASNTPSPKCPKVKVLEQGKANFYANNDLDLISRFYTIWVCEL